MTNNALVKFMESIFRDRIKIWNYFFQSKFQKIRSVSAELEISLPKSPGCFTIYYPKNKSCQLVPHERLCRIREITSKYGGSRAQGNIFFVSHFQAVFGNKIGWYPPLGVGVRPTRLANLSEISLLRKTQKPMMRKR